MLPTRQLLLGVLVTLLLLSGQAAPAQAETRPLRDPRDRSIAARYDMRSVTLNSRETRLVTRVRVRALRIKDVLLVVRFRDGRGAPHRAFVYADGSTRFSEVAVQVNVGDPWTVVPCDGLRQRWSRKSDQIVLSLPHSCGGAAFNRFRITTGKWGAAHPSDVVRSRATLLPGAARVLE
ncbi:hypothetical protein [Nocardioides pelophilus]|uniref:hypothetical protein n=1 Tax=Nocardioides pelophilus TaxID=2172019 RepID=UPI0016029C60|nr:hypothetical protein [Nocardioides pelophilus]